MAEAIYQTIARAKVVDTFKCFIDDQGDLIETGVKGYVPLVGNILLRAQPNTDVKEGGKEFKSFCLRFPGVADPKDVNGYSVKLTAFTDAATTAMGELDDETFKRTVFSSAALSGIFLGFAANPGETLAQSMRLALAEIVTFVEETEEHWGTSDSRDPLKHLVKALILLEFELTPAKLAEAIEKAKDQSEDWGKDKNGKRRLSKAKPAKDKNAPAPKSDLADEDK